MDTPSHPIDRLLHDKPPVSAGTLRAWLSPDYEPDDPEGLRLARALLRLPAAVEERIGRAPDAFLSAAGVADTPEARAAWTEPLGPWLRGSSARLVPPEPLLHLAWPAWDDEDREYAARLEAVAITPERGLVLFSSRLVGADPDDPHDFSGVPQLVGLITREDASRSLALLLSRLEASLLEPAVAQTDFDSDLPWAEVVRLVYASQRRQLPRVLDMTPEALELIWEADFG